MPVTISIHEVHETACNLFVAGEKSIFILVFGNVSREEMEEGIDQVHSGRTVLCVNDFAEEAEIVNDTLNLLRAHVPDRVDIDMRDEREGKLQVHLHHKLARDGHHIEFHVVGGRLQAAHEEIGDNQIAVIRMKAVVLVVDRGSESSFRNKLNHVARRKKLGGQGFQE